MAHATRGFDTRYEKRTFKACPFNPFFQSLESSRHKYPSNYGTPRTGGGSEACAQAHEPVHPAIGIQSLEQRALPFEGHLEGRGSGYSGICGTSVAQAGKRDGSSYARGGAISADGVGTARATEQSWLHSADGPDGDATTHAAWHDGDDRHPCKH